MQSLQRSSDRTKSPEPTTTFDDWCGNAEREEADEAHISGYREPYYGMSDEPDAEDLNGRTDDEIFITANAPLVYMQNNSGSIKSVSRNSLRNSLLPIVGLLELANSGDFAANVFNDIPVPTFAAVLMGIGGSIALSMSVFAAWDAKLSWQNISALRKERRFLLSTTYGQHQVPQGTDGEPQPLTASRSVALKTYLDINAFETLTEIFDRFTMDLTMGFGAILVGVGTLMAIGGANQHVFEASNLLSGYIGNGPAALYGVARMAWSTYVWVRANRHSQGWKTIQDENSGRQVNMSIEMDLITNHQTAGLHCRYPSTTASSTVFHRRYRRLKIYALVAGPTTLVAGAGSMITATRWWGYVILVPCIVLSFVCNWYFRRGIGYQRPLFVVPDVKKEREAQTQQNDNRCARPRPDESVNDFGKELTGRRERANGLNSMRTLKTGEIQCPQHDVLDSITGTRLLQELQDAIILRQSLERVDDPEALSTADDCRSKDFRDPTTSLFFNMLKLDLLESFYMRLLSRPTAWFIDDFKPAIHEQPDPKPLHSRQIITIGHPRQLWIDMMVMSNSSPLLRTSQQPHGAHDGEQTSELCEATIPPPSRNAATYILNTAKACLSSQGHRHAQYRERYMVELLGSWLHHRQMCERRKEVGLANIPESDRTPKEDLRS